jgi:hypothetical protein
MEPVLKCKPRGPWQVPRRGSTGDRTTVRHINPLTSKIRTDLRRVPPGCRGARCGPDEFPAKPLIGNALDSVRREWERGRQRYGRSTACTSPVCRVGHIVPSGIQARFLQEDRPVASAEPDQWSHAPAGKVSPARMMAAQEPRWQRVEGTTASNGQRPGCGGTRRWTPSYGSGNQP